MGVRPEKKIRYFVTNSAFNFVWNLQTVHFPQNVSNSFEKDFLSEFQMFLQNNRLKFFLQKKNFFSLLLHIKIINFLKKFNKKTLHRYFFTELLKRKIPFLFFQKFKRMNILFSHSKILFEYIHKKA